MNSSIKIINEKRNMEELSKEDIMKLNRQELTDQLLKLREQQALTFRTIARSLGISESALSQWTSDTYKGDSDTIDGKVRAYLMQMGERLKMPKQELKFVETSIVTKTFEVARSCHLYGEMGVEYGDSGLGKTWAVREYARRNPDVILIEIDDRCAYKTSLVRTLHKRLGGDGTGKVSELLDYIIGRLNGSNRMLIIDEAERLYHDTLEMIRRLHDFTGIGVLLVGMPALVENLKGKRRDYAQLYSRVTLPCRLEQLSLEDTSAAVQTILPSANGLAKVFHENCNNSMRILRTLIIRSIRVAELNGGNLDAQVIRTVRKEMIA